MTPIPELRNVEERSFWQATMPALPDRTRPGPPGCRRRGRRRWRAHGPVRGPPGGGARGERRPARGRADRLGRVHAQRRVLPPRVQAVADGPAPAPRPGAGRGALPRDHRGLRARRAAVHDLDRGRLRPYRPPGPRVGAVPRLGLRRVRGGDGGRGHGRARRPARGPAHGDRERRVRRRDGRRIECRAPSGQARRRAGRTGRGCGCRPLRGDGAPGRCGGRPTGGRSWRPRAAR